MFDFLNTYSNFWSLVDTLLTFTTLSLGIFLFFNDPLRRWQFFGFKPSLVVVLYDPKIKKVLLVEEIVWEFPQGNIYGSDIYSTLEQILTRELNIESNFYKIDHLKVLGTAKISRSRNNGKRTFGAFSLYNKLQGKGYIACYTMADLSKLPKLIKKGVGITDVKILSYKKAIKQIEESYKLIGKQEKMKLVRKIFRELETI